MEVEDVKFKRSRRIGACLCRQTLFSKCTTIMENPHAERQAVLLERILKNTSKCTETILELNKSLEEIIQANYHLQTAANLSMQYRKNVQYNLTSAKSRHTQHHDKP
ncbi:hypothetical protein DFJ43DRAFT_1112377 [Lentinula guzmanii]|uniref:DASH complex subunit DAD4 n=2 Tax=Lentinula TaxID=5352 RepID=A0AA38JGM7_9AGAR|nr:hypothetical protein DFJ43DRAFT_1112377 [Lentinula guzmanii]